MADDQPVDPEVSDLQTAKIALHGALAMLRNVQEINQRLKGELQEALNREKLSIQRSQTQEQKDKELRHAREELLKKDRALAQLSEESAAALVRAREEWAQTLARLDAQYREHLQKSAETRQTDAELFVDERVTRLKERCEALEKQMATQEHALTQEFYGRLQVILQQTKEREQNVWFETTRLRDDIRYELEQQFKQRLSLIQEEHRTALAALESRLREQSIEVDRKKQALQQDFTRREEQMRLQLEEALQISEREFRLQTETLQAKYTAQVQELREDRQKALDAALIAEKHPEQFFRKEQEAFRAQTIAEFADKERQLQEHFLALQREAEARHTQALAEHESRSARALADHQTRALADRQELSERARREQSDLIVRSEASEQQLQKHFEEQNQQMRADLHQLNLQLQAAMENHRTREVTLNAQLVKADADRRQAEEKILELELALSRNAHAGEAMMRSALESREEAHRAEIARLRDEIQALDTRQSELKHSLRQSQHQEAVLRESLRKGVTEQRAEWAKRHAELEQTLHDKELAMETQIAQMEKVLRTAAVDKEATLTREFEQALADHQKAFAARLQELSANAKDGLQQNPQTLMDEWIFGFAHQIRNPLAIIRSTAEALSDAKASAADNPKAFASIIQSVDALTERLAQFMELSKPMAPATTPVALDQIMAKALTGIKPHLAQAGIRVQLTADPDLPLIPGRSDHFEKVFVALLQNALEAMPRGGALEIQLHHDRAARQFHILLHDTGVSIQHDHLTQVGRPFFTTKKGHVGLGLAHAKRILQIYGGRLVIENAPAGGVTITATLPNPEKAG